MPKVEIERLEEKEVLCALDFDFQLEVVNKRRIQLGTR